jgi:hypothetical protein
MERARNLSLKSIIDVIAIILVTKNIHLLSRKNFLERMAINEKYQYIKLVLNKQNVVDVNIQLLSDFYEKERAKRAKRAKRAERSETVEKIKLILTFLQSMDRNVELNVKNLETFQNESKELLIEKLPGEFVTKRKVKQEDEEQTIFRIIILTELIRILEKNTNLLDNKKFKRNNTNFLKVPKSSKTNKKVFDDFRECLGNVENKGEIYEKVENILIDLCDPTIKNIHLRDSVKQVERISISMKLFLEQIENRGANYRKVCSLSREKETIFIRLLNNMKENPNKITEEEIKKLIELEKEVEQMEIEIDRRAKFDVKYGI